jgi:hypothetical protein
MAYENEHPIKTDARRYHGERLDDAVDAWFIRQDPPTRRAYLGQLENTVSADDGVSLRRKASLMRDVQRLAQIDRELRAASR